jgi:anti-anti-sigma regulatory factor
MPLVGELDDARLRLIQEQALHALEHSSACYLVLDITGVPIIDSQVAQGLLAVVQAGRLLGAEVMLVGIRPEVAQARRAGARLSSHAHIQRPPDYARPHRCDLTSICLCQQAGHEG